jgi:photosystem II stability/assembly factor-like uncharacterized protein
MKISNLFLVVLYLVAFDFYAKAQNSSSPKDKNAADYWLERMSDPNVNYYSLVNEFDNFWEGKTPTKNSGYKLFKRWQHQMRPYVNIDGYIRNPGLDIQEHKTFQLQNAGDNIVGTWSFVGPNLFPQQYYGNQCPGLGRVSALAFHPTDPNILFAGAPLGGLWKSTDGGQNWASWHTDELDVVGISDIVINPSDPDIIYLATGDRDDGSGWGAGVYKSTDGGYTWEKKNTGMGNVVVSKLKMHPLYTNRLMAAASDGIYESSSQGEIWYKVLNLSGRTKDMVIKPGEPNTVYVCNDNSIYKTTDFGSNWGSPALVTDSHRMVMAVTPANPSRVYVLATQDSKFYRVYFSDNSGENWSEVESTGMENEGQGGYNLDMAADPVNPNILYAGMVTVFKSTDGGTSWTMIANAGQIHADQHVFEVSPHTNSFLYIGNDGGVYKMAIGGGTHPVMTISNGLAISQVMRLGTSATNPDLMITGMQDCGSYVTSTNPWLHRVSGDGMNCAIDYLNPLIMYGTSQLGHINRSTDGGNSFYEIARNGLSGINQTGSWYSAFILDHTTPSTMYAGFKDVWRSTNVTSGSPTFVNISAGQLSGKEIDHIEQSPADGNYMFVTDVAGNRLFYSTNATISNPGWTEVSKPFYGANGVTWIEAHPTDKNVFYFTLTSKVYKYNIATQQWTNLTGYMPSTSKLCIVYQDESNEGLYVGTTTGVYYKDTEMTDWVLFKSGLPLTNVFDLEINYHTDPPQLFAGTFGRGIWKTDIYSSPKPNLVPIGGNSQVSGTQVSMFCTFQNQSEIASSGPFKIGYYLSMNEYITTMDILIGEQSMPNTGTMIIGQGQLPTIDVALITPEISSGTYYLGAYLDYLSAVSELSETDNGYTAPGQVTIPPPPAAPSNIIVSDGTHSDHIAIDWTPVSGGTYYYALYRSITNDPQTAVKITGDTWITNYFYDDYSAPRGINVYYWVKASLYPIGIRSSGFSNSDIGWYPLAPPANVNATDGLYDDKVVITWTVPENGYSYRVFRNTVNNPATATNLTGLSWILSTSWTDITAVTGTNYYYWVKAARSISGSRSSDYSSGNTGWVAFADAPEVTATDGTFTDRVVLNWNSIQGANYYKVFFNTINNPENSQELTGWITDITYYYNTQMPGTILYYWVMAASDQQGTISTGLGLGDSGWMNFIPPSNVQATDGTILEAVTISWNYVQGGSYYRVYRGLTSSVESALPIGNWFLGNQFLDTSGIPGRNAYYRVRVANDTLVTISGASAYDIGWGLLAAPTVTATKGVFSDKVEITWQSVNGGVTYRIFRNISGNPQVETLTDWSSDLNYFFEDETAILGTQYLYSVKAARNSSGYRESEAGVDIGYANECGNMVEDIAYRHVNFHGSTLEIFHRVYNEGPFPFLNPGQIAIALENGAPFGSPEFIVGYVDTPPLDVNEHFDVYFTVDLDTIPLGPVPYGTWYVACFMSWDWNNCETNFDDDYIVWDEQPFVFTDAMHGTYTIDPSTGDFYDISKALLALETKGISDPVTFNIKPGIFYEQNSIPAITGATSNKRIVFQKHPDFTDTALVVFTPSPSENYTIRFNSSSFITLQNLKLSTTGFTNYQSNYGRVIEFAGNCQDIHILNCHITGFTDVSKRTYDNTVIFGENTNSSNLVIANNQILNGLASIYLEGMNMNTNPLTGLTIDSNSITGFHSEGIKLSYSDHFIIKDNLIESSISLMSHLMGIHVENTCNGFVISGNKILMNPSDLVIRGVYLSNVSRDGNQPGLIVNNFISIMGQSNYCYGIMLMDLHKTRIYNNSIHLFGNPSSFSTNLLFDCSNIPGQYFDNSMFNNILSNQLNGYCLTYNENANTYLFLAESDRNNFFTTGQDIIYMKNSYGIQSVSQWYNETGLDFSSVTVNPEILSNTDLHSNSGQMDNLGIALEEVTTDIDGEMRDPLHPDIGADEYTYIQPSLELKVYLEGPYDGNEMKLDLAVSGLIPLSQPYITLPWNYEGIENVAVLPDNVIDWVLIELRDAPTAAQANLSTRITRMAGFLKKNGMIVGIDGTSPLSFNQPVNHGLFVIVRHRNHLDIISAVPLIKNGATYSFDFTTGTSQAFGDSDGYKQAGTGVALMVSGDVNADGYILINDKMNGWTPESGRKGYLNSDFNCDSEVNNTDKNLIWLPNFDYGYWSQVPE